MTTATLTPHTAQGITEHDLALHAITNAGAGTDDIQVASVVVGLKRDTDDLVLAVALDPAEVGNGLTTPEAGLQLSRYLLSRKITAFDLRFNTPRAVLESTPTTLGEGRFTSIHAQIALGLSSRSWRIGLTGQELVDSIRPHVGSLMIGDDPALSQERLSQTVRYPHGAVVIPLLKSVPGLRVHVLNTTLVNTRTGRPLAVLTRKDHLIKPTEVRRVLTALTRQMRVPVLHAEVNPRKRTLTTRPYGPNVDTARYTTTQTVTRDDLDTVLMEWVNERG